MENLRFLDKYIPSKNVYVITALGSNNCDLPRKETVIQSFKLALVSVSSVPSWFLFLFNDSSGAVCFQGTHVSVCTCPFPGLWSLPIMKRDILFLVFLKHGKKAFWSQLSDFQISVVLLLMVSYSWNSRLWYLFCHCYFWRISKLPWFLLVYPHKAKIESQAVRSELHRDLGLAPTISFLDVSLDSNWVFSQAEAVLVKVFVLKGGKSPLRRFPGHVPTIYWILGSLVRQALQVVERKKRFWEV